MAQEEYVTYETAKLLKECGFQQHVVKSNDGLNPKEVHMSATELMRIGDNELVYVYDAKTYERAILITARYASDNGMKYYIRPSQAVAMRWLREEKGYVITISYGVVGKLFHPCVSFKRKRAPQDYYYATYEQAAEAGIKAACEYIINK